MKKEAWRVIKEYETLYEVSNLGRVRSLNRKWNTGIGVVSKKGHILKQSLRGNYYKVSLCKNGVVKIISVHRLVATAFLSNPKNKTLINHKDGNKNNNCQDNLEWCTASENQYHAYATGLKTSWLSGKSGVHHNRSVIVYNTITKKKCNITAAAIEVGVSNMHMNRMINGSRTNWTNFIKK